jgi:DNA-binding GntR family transcriptional regulator
MARRTAPIAGIDSIVVPDGGVGVPVLHAYLRESILDGRLKPGTKLSQVALAEQLGVSRTPLREVLRRLEQEGLVEIEPNQRTRVAAFDAGELDVQHALRILGETLALSMTVTTFTRDQYAEGTALLQAMRDARAADDATAWFEAHEALHRVVTGGAPESLRRQLRSLTERTTPQRRDAWHRMPPALQEELDRQHSGILESVWRGQENVAIGRLARHLGASATRALAAQAPGYAATAIAHAQRIATHVGDLSAEGVATVDDDTDFDPASVQSIYAQRIALETVGARMTAVAQQQEAIDQLADALDRMRGFSSGSPTSHWQAAHREFHLAASNALGDDLLEVVDGLIERSRHFMLMHSPENTDAWSAANTLHEATFEAISRGDGAAAAAATANELARPSLSLIAYFAPGVDAHVLRNALAQFAG